MNGSSPDLTNRIDPAHADALGRVAEAAEHAGVTWFLVGAMARDWLLEVMYGVATKRQTRDADIAIALPDWPTFERMKQRIVASGAFAPHPRIAHRLDHTALNGFHLDLVPFGAIAGTDASISWPPEHAVVMNVTGFADALAAALTLRVTSALSVRVVSLPGLALLKCFAWQDRHRTSSKDAWDLKLLLTTYCTAGNRDRLYDEGVMAAEDDVEEFAGCRLLGRDVAKVAAARTRATLAALIDDALDESTPDALIEDMAYVREDGKSANYRAIDSGAAIERARHWLWSFRAGLNEAGA